LIFSEIGGKPFGHTASSLGGFNMAVFAGSHQWQLRHDEVADFYNTHLISPSS
jgi:hypothetical protein